MLNFNRRDGAPDPKDAGKFALKPALYEPPQAPSSSPSAAATPRAPSATRAEPASAGPSTPAAPAAPAPTAAPTTAAIPKAGPVAAGTQANPQGSTLSVGPSIKLKGVEVSDCDNLVIEGNVEATVHSRAMQIEKQGTLKGTAHIEIAEVHGEFTGELTARTRLVVHGSGRVSGTIRYGSLVVAEGGVLSGDVQQIERAGEAAAATRGSTSTQEAVARRA
ncbi:MAG: polymer-forming cytoskeletal protein [Casimicrobiaceae bacterium]